MRNKSLKVSRLSRWILTATGGLMLLFPLALSLFTEDYRMILAAALYSVLITFLFVIYMIHTRRRITRFSERICTTIEDMVNGEQDPRLFFDEETLLSKINHRLSRLYESMLENSQRTLTEKESFQELISDISHQVKTPIANLKMVNATLLEHPMPPAEQQNFLKAANSQLNKLDFLMQSMIKTSRLETGLITLSLKPASLYETIAVNMYDVMLLAEKKFIDIDIDCDPALIVPHDRKWTAEAIFNVLENAVKYTPKHGKVNIRAEQQEMYTKIFISDTGKGIAEEYFTKIFKRFYREPEVHDLEGAGIGLYLAREILSLQNGYIMVESKKGKGSTFILSLPNV